MTKQILRILAFLCVILLLQTGCAMRHSGQNDEKPALAVKELVKTGKSWNGESLPAYPHGQPEITILRIVIPAGTRLATHSHPVMNAGVLVSGQLTVVTADGKTLRLKAGDPIVEVVNTMHHGLNEGDIPAEIIVFYAGTTGSPITLAE